MQHKGLIQKALRLHTHTCDIYVKKGLDLKTTQAWRVERKHKDRQNSILITLCKVHETQKER